MASCRRRLAGGGGRDDAAVGSWVAGDFNGDGRTDLAVAEPAYHVGTPTAAPAQIQLFLSTGLGFTVQTVNMPGWRIGNASLSNAGGYVGDFAGEGKDAIAWRDYDPSDPVNTPRPLVVFKSNGPAPDLMTGITASMGAVTTIGYTTSDNWANTNLPFIMQTASSLSVNDGRGNVSTTHVSYAGGLWDAFERRFLGFSRGGRDAALQCRGEPLPEPGDQLPAEPGLRGPGRSRSCAATARTPSMFQRDEGYAVNDTQLPYTALNTSTMDHGEQLRQATLRT